MINNSFGAPATGESFHGAVAHRVAFAGETIYSIVIKAAYFTFHAFTAVGVLALSRSKARCNVCKIIVMLVTSSFIQHGK